MRIACVQNGDFSNAYRTLRSGGEETYNHQRYTIEAFTDFVQGRPSVVISLDADAHEEHEGSHVRMSVGRAERRPYFPQRWALRAQAQRIIATLEELETTHLLVRCVDLVGCELLEWANWHGIATAAIIAARFDPSQPIARRFCELANHYNVAFVANHNRVATESLVECGLERSKAIAWDMPPSLTPSQYSPRLREAGQPLRIVSAGTVESAKGIGDLVSACHRARAAGTALTLTVCGDGALLPSLRQDPGVRDGWLECPGRISHVEVLRRMLAADVVAVPSRSSFLEGLPFVIQESLALRTPLVLSDHPVFVRYFQDKTAVRFFREGNAGSLAALLTELANDPVQYANLSQQSADAWASLACSTHFHHLLQRLSVEWNLDTPVSCVSSQPSVLTSNVMSAIS